MNNEQSLSIGSKWGCLKIIGDNNNYPKETINEYFEKLDSKESILDAKINNLKVNLDNIKESKIHKFICKCCNCGELYVISESNFFSKKHRYCCKDCFKDVVYDKNENFNIDYANTIHESLNILECVEEKNEYDSFIEKRIKHICICKKYKCKCYLCKKEYEFNSMDFEIKKNEHGDDGSYFSKAHCSCHKISSFQWRTVDILKKNNINYKVEVSFPDLFGSINNLKYDFATFNSDGSIKVLIECQGQQHYKPVEEFGGEQQFQYQLEKDKLKRNYAKKNGINLVEIPYNKCNTYEKELKFLQEHNVI